MHSSVFSRACVVALTVTLTSVTCLAAVLGTPGAHTQSLDFARHGNEVAKRADPSLVGYLGAFFLGADPYVYFYLSDHNNPTSFKALNKGSPVIKPTKGTGGVRDPALVRGGGDEAGKKWYIVGTDLDIGKVRMSPGSSRATSAKPVGRDTADINTLTDILGCCAKNRIQRYLRLGEYRSRKLGERKASDGRGCHRRHGLGTRGDLGPRERYCDQINSPHRYEDK